VFGRLVKLIKPGDNASFPTVSATYYDAERPFRYLVQAREQAGNSDVRVSLQFYDGLGRQLQTKQESTNAGV